MLPAVPRHWTLLKAMRILGVPMLSIDPNRGGPAGRRNEGMHIPKRMHGGQTGTRGGWIAGCHGAPMISVAEDPDQRWIVIVRCVVRPESTAEILRSEPWDSARQPRPV